MNTTGKTLRELKAIFATYRRIVVPEGYTNVISKAVYWFPTVVSASDYRFAAVGQFKFVLPDEPNELPFTGFIHIITGILSDRPSDIDTFSGACELYPL